MQKWEYLRIAARYEQGVWGIFVNNEGQTGERIGDLTGRLNDFGEEGWELVNVAPSPNGMALFFKRPKN